MEGHEQQVAEAGQRGRADERRAGGGAARHPRERQRTGEHRDDVGADDDRHERGGESQPVAVDVGVGARERRQRPLRAEHADAEQPGREQHRPHRRAAQHAEVDERVGAAQLVPDEGHEHQEATGHDQPRPGLFHAVDAHERQPAGDDEHRHREQGDAAGVDAAGQPVDALRHLGEHDEEHPDDEQTGQQQHDPQRVGQGGADEAAGERAGDGAGLQRRHDQAGGAAGLRRSVRQPARSVVDERHLQGEPRHVEALHRPRHDEDGEALREGQRDARRRRHRHRHEQHPPVAVQVAQLGEHRNDDRRQHQLCGLEPVDVGVVDRQVPRDVAQQRRVVALQHPAGELDEDEVADDAAGQPARPSHRASLGPPGTPSGRFGAMHRSR